MSRVYLEQRDAFHVPGAKSASEIEVALGRAAQALLACDAWIITAGAGMGVDSGLPDFRGTTGLWKDRGVAMSYEDMSDDKWFTEDPLFAWGVNYTQLEMYRKTVPHNGFNVLLKWAQTLGKDYYVWTSNIDGQFQKAGFPDDKVITCHGDMHHLQCIDSKCRAEKKDDDVWRADRIPSGLGENVDADCLKFRDSALLEEDHFRCPRCNRLARPNVWFCHDRNHVYRESSHRKHSSYLSWLRALEGRGAKLVVIECGGGLAIPSVRIEGEDNVENCGDGSVLVRLNPKDCNVPAERGLGLALGSRDGLERLDKKLDALQRKPGATAGGSEAKKSVGAKPKLRSTR